MKNKISALFLALFFPFLHLFFRTLTPRAAFAVSPSWAKGAAPWLLTVSAALTLLAVFCIFRLTGRPVKTLFPAGRLRPATSLTLAEIALGLCVTLNTLILLLPLPESWASEYSDRLSDPLAAAGLIPRFLCTVIAAPLVEEVIFRGLCFRYLRRAFSPHMAILWQAMLFAAFHGTKLQMVYAFPAGIVLGIVYVRCGTITAPLFLHMIFNAAGLFHMPLPDPVWGRLLWLLAGMAITGLGLRALTVRRAVPRAPSNMSPRPPRR